MFSQEVYIPSSQLAQLKEKVFTTETEILGNIKRQVSSKDRVQYFHEDKGKKCAEINYDLAEIEGDAKKDMKARARVKTLDLSKIRPSFIKASSKITTYGVLLF